MNRHLHNQVVKNWERDFKFGRRPVNKETGLQKNIDLVLKDKRTTVKCIAQTCGFAIGSVENSLLKELGLGKMAAR